MGSPLVYTMNLGQVIAGGRFRSVQVWTLETPLTSATNLFLSQITLPVPVDGGSRHVFMPVIIWLDKGMVTKRVRMHPILMRAAFLPGQIRNGSGNGGGILIGFMPIVRVFDSCQPLRSLTAPKPLDPKNPADRRSTSMKDEWQRFKREVYHKVLRVILRSLRGPGSHGEPIQCGDGIERIMYPGIMIASLDNEEACTYCGCRASLANYPCPRCLVHADDTHQLTLVSNPRSTESMQAVYEEAKDAPSRTQHELILRDNGLNNVKASPAT